uniref:Uncharacterized protein n=1 Tax=Cucumis melo TaxID=3656 RepID=A0A9I9E9N7_CUCME
MKLFGSVFYDGLILKTGIFTSTIYTDDCLFEDPTNHQISSLKTHDVYGCYERGRVSNEYFMDKMIGLYKESVQSVKIEIDGNKLVIVRYFRRRGMNGWTSLRGVLLSITGLSEIQWVLQESIGAVMPRLQLVKYQNRGRGRRREKEGNERRRDKNTSAKKEE